MWQQDEGRLHWSSRAHVPPGSPRGQRGLKRGKAGQEEEEEEGRQPWGGMGGQDPAPAQHGAGGGDVVDLTPLRRLSSPSIPAALRLIRAGELLRAAGGGDRRGERSPWLPGSY